MVVPVTHNMPPQTPQSEYLMTRLTEALQTLGVQGEILLSGRWIKIRGERCSVYVAEITWNQQYCTWCDAPGAREARFYSDPTEAIKAGLRRAGFPQVDR